MKDGKVKIGLIIVLVITAGLVITATLMVLNMVNKNKELNPPVNNGEEENNGSSGNNGNTNQGGRPPTNVPSNEGGSSEPVDEKKNTGDKLNAERKLEGLEIKNIVLTQGAVFANFSATVKNATGSDTNNRTLQIEFVNKDGVIIETIDTYLPDIKNGEEVTINATSGVYLLDAYDFTIKYKK